MSSVLWLFFFYSSYGLELGTLIWLKEQKLRTGVQIYKKFCEFEGGIEIPVPRITNLQHKACQVMTNGDLRMMSFLSHTRTNNRLFFLFVRRQMPDFYILKKGVQTFLNTL